MRLIDVDKLLDDYSVFGMTNISKEGVRDELYDLIDNQQTAYDVDKVVEELEELEDVGGSWTPKRIYAHKAIKIVKQGLKEQKKTEVVEVEKVLLILNALGISQKSEETIKMMLGTQSFDLAEYDKKIRAEVIKKYMSKLCEHCMQQTNECYKLECPFCTDGCDIINIAEQVTDQKGE